MGILRAVSRSNTPFCNREEAADLLCAGLSEYQDCSPIVLGIPRGGITAASIITRRIGGELNVVFSQKFRVGSKASSLVVAVTKEDQCFIRETGLSEARELLEQEQSVPLRDLKRRAKEHRALCPPVELTGRSVIVVDDGTMGAALRTLARKRPARLIAAVPVGPENAVSALAAAADRIICLRVPGHFIDIGELYTRFQKVLDHDVRAILRQERRRNKIC
jgi:predicted phosphoribosyltransferase